jgi:hypothetical protein
VYDGRGHPLRFHRAENRMDKKIKKKIDLLHQHIQRLKNQLAGARKQQDEPGEVDKLEKELAAAQQQLAQLQSSG